MFSPNEHAENFAYALLGQKLYVISKSNESAHHKFAFELVQNYRTQSLITISLHPF